MFWFIVKLHVWKAKTQFFAAKLLEHIGCVDSQNSLSSVNTVWIMCPKLLKEISTETLNLDAFIIVYPNKYTE